MTVDVHWFGKRWDAEICKALGRGIPVPSAGVCFHCSRRFEVEDQGVELREPSVVVFFHRKCLPLWTKERRLPLDIRRVMDRITVERKVNQTLRCSEDRRASECYEEERAAALEPGDAWESPSWEDP